MNETFSINFMIDLELQIKFMIDHGSGDLFIYKMNLYTYL